MFCDLDRIRLTEALSLAECAIGLSDPNPRVGCIIGRSSGEVLGQGHTQRVGEAHAEIMALRDCAAQGADVRGATVWVTLEPCSHHGRTPPCCDALVAAGVARVVVAMADPFPSVAGAGIERLRAAGIAVELADPSIARVAADLNIGFVSRHLKGRPWVRLKSAISLDGRTALTNGESQWITGEAARVDGHSWRRRAGAVLTGIGTVLRDDPRLDVRLVPTALQPLRVVVDSTWRMPANARVLRSAGHALVCGLTEGAASARDRLGAMTECLSLPISTEMTTDESTSRVDLCALLTELCKRQVNEIHVEGGPTLSGAMLRQDLVDELLLFVAPVMLGPGLPLAALPPLEKLSAARRWQVVDSASIGSDLRLRFRAIDPEASGDSRAQVSQKLTPPARHL